MTDRTTIKIEITAFDDKSTTTHRVHTTSDDHPAATIWQIARMLDRFGWVEEPDEREREPRPTTYRERLAEVSGLDPCELDVSESEAPRPNASPDIDTDKQSAQWVIEWAAVCTDVAALRRAITREQAREHATPRKVVRSSVIKACTDRLCEINGAQA